MQSERDDLDRFKQDALPLDPSSEAQKMQAVQILADFESEQDETQLQWAFQVDKRRVIQELTRVIFDPSSLDQNRYPLCGPDSYLRVFALYHPEIYIQFVIDVLKTGTGRLGTQVVTAPKGIKEKNTWAQNMRISDWIATASLRSQSNSVFSDVPEDTGGIPGLFASFAGMSSLDEISGWFLNAGIPQGSITQRGQYILSNATKADITGVNQRYAQRLASFTSEPDGLTGYHRR